MAKAIWLSVISAPVLILLFVAFPLTMTAVGIGLLLMLVAG